MRKLYLKLTLGATLLVSSTAQAGGEQQTVDEAKALGNAQAQTQNAALKNGTATTAVTSTNPHYTASPPEAQYYATKDLASPAQAQAAKCKATPLDPTCAGVAQGTATRPASTVTIADKALMGQTVGANPTLIFGEIAQTYNACSAGGKYTAPGSFYDLSCSLDTGFWSNKSCSKSFVVATVHKYSCVEGASVGSQLLSLPDGQDVLFAAECKPLSGDNLTFILNTRGAVNPPVHCGGNQSHKVDLSNPVAYPVLMPPPLDVYWHGACQQAEIYWEGAGCSNRTCALNWHVGQGMLRRANYQCATSGDVAGNLINFDAGYSPPADPQGHCYRAFSSASAAAPLTGGRGNFKGKNAYWADTGPAVYQGFEFIDDPGSSVPFEHHVVSMAFEQPRLTDAPGVVLNNNCADLEAKTPQLQPDGTNVAALPVLPGIANIGQQQCVRTKSICTEGAETRIVDGKPVTQECWRYDNVFACTALEDPSTCVGAPTKGCQLANSTCSLDDGQGHCLHAQLNHTCQASEASFTPAINCGNQSYCAAGSCYDTTYAPNQDFAYTVSQMEAHVEAGIDLDEQSMQIFKGTDDRCSRDHIGISDCCGGASVTNCSDAEKATVDKRSAGKCHQVGQFCSSGNIFGCYKTTETYCCFSSLLARLVQVQGRAQMNKGWGAPKTPDCSGFTPEELAALDWSKFDFTEFYATITPVPLDTPAATQGATDAQQSCYWGSGRC